MAPAAPRRLRLLCAAVCAACALMVHAAGALPDADALTNAAEDDADAPSQTSSLIRTGVGATATAVGASSGPQQLLHVAVRVSHPSGSADGRCVSVRPEQGVLAVRPVNVTDPSPVYLPSCAAKDTKLRGFRQPCYRTCSLVGSSGVLGNSSWGGKIDGSEAVIRLNNAPVVGYEADVGARTTVRIIHDAHLTTANINKLAATTSDGFTVMWPPRRRPNSTRTGGPTPRFGDVSSFLEEYAFRKRRACAPILRYSPEAYAEVYRLSGLLVGRYPPVVPSTGFLAVVTALQLCREVTVYGLSWGMAPASARRWRRSHAKDAQKPTYYYTKKNHISGADRDVSDNESLYYDRVRSFGFTHHDLDAEKGALSSLARAHSLEFL